MKRRGPSLRELVGILVTLAPVMGLSAAVLRVIDAMPAYLGGAGRALTPVASVEELERRVRQRLLLPAYFPDSLRWPPVAIRVHGPAAVWVTLVFADQAGETVVVLGQSIGAPAALPAALPDSGRVLQTVSVALHGTPARLVRLVDADGRVWHELAWSVGERRLVLRSRHPVDELVRMAESVRSRP